VISPKPVPGQAIRANKTTPIARNIATAGS
jgi:hypothetical protein